MRESNALLLSRLCLKTPQGLWHCDKAQANHVERATWTKSHGQALRRQTYKEPLLDWTAQLPADCSRMNDPSQCHEVESGESTQASSSETDPWDCVQIK
jgi:hypothetical protein